MTSRTIFPLIVSAVLCGQSMAVVLGPTYPAPGGNTFTNTGGVSAADGLAIWDYSAFDDSMFDELYFGPNQVDFGPICAGLSGTCLPMSYSGATGSTATWSVMSPYTTAGGSAPPSGTYPIELRLTIPSATWLDPVPLGIPASVGAVVDNSAGNDFTLQFEFVADMGSGFIPLNDVPQAPNPPDQTRSSVANGFYYTVPEPGFPILGCALALVIAMFTLRNK